MSVWPGLPSPGQLAALLAGESIFVTLVYYLCAGRWPWQRRRDTGTAAGEDGQRERAEDRS